MKENNIRIKPYFSVIGHSPDFIELRSGVWNHISYTLQDDTNSGMLYRFIKALDGTSSLKEITSSLNMARSEAEAIIDHLNQLNVIDTGPATAFDYYTDIYAPAFKNREINQEELLKKKVYIISDEKLGEEIQEQLSKSLSIDNAELISENHSTFKFLESNDQSWLYNAILFEELLQEFKFLENGFVILALEHINPIFAKKFNRIATALNITWIQSAIDGPFIFIGPLFEKNNTACYECFETRVSMNLREYHSYQKYKAAIIESKIIKKAEFPMRNMLTSLMINHLILEVFNYLLTECSFTKNKVLSIFLPTMEITFNEFLKVSNCQTCGSQPHRDDSQLFFDVQGLLKEER
ncbi:TOMM precursor leader peptide-binding protein [Legionella dresdenensis]|uniref:TOMM leader peptide-binding protein n=1 Tax=Legionella dresdenensis TaxID=450200 RepID=A0ABV8CFQ3_9GAMM